LNVSLERLTYMERMPRMTWFHPNDCPTVWPRIAQPLALALSFCLVGCTNQQMSASNPFLGPDRVPPPATRTIAPGTAAPYYPGSPVPAAQIAPPAPPIAQAPAAAGPAAVAVAATPVAATQPNSPAFTNEPTVAIPADNQALRFALPAPPVNQVAQQPTQPQPVAPVVAPASAVIPAAYNQPIQPSANQQPVPPPTPMADTGSSGPWRSPQVPQSSSPVMQAQYVQPQPAQPTMLAAQQPVVQPPAVAAAPMPVELRPASTVSPQVASAPSAPPSAMAQTQIVPAPRMRFPSLLEPSTWFTPQPDPAANQQLIGYMVPGPDGQMHMVSVEQYQASLGGGGAQQTPSVASSDGFRPRGTTTK
jgi:hypothetical protein